MVWLPALFVAAAIFWFSAQPAEASTDMSDGVSRLLLWLATKLHLIGEPTAGDYAMIEWMSMPVRKCAHITEYLVLHLTLLFALYGQGIRGQKWLRTGLLLVFLYACTDEFHQLFVPGRAGLLTDVLIDSSGAALVTLVWGWRLGCGKKK